MKMAKSCNVTLPSRVRSSGRRGCSISHWAAKIEKSVMSTVSLLSRSAMQPAVDKDMLACGVLPQAPMFTRLPWGQSSEV